MLSLTRVCNFPMKFSDREIAREIKFPDRESREIGKYLCTCLEISFLLAPGEYWVELNYLKANFDAKSYQR